MADILIVEDHLLTLKLARLTLQCEGHHVRTAPNVANALAQARMCLPDLVVLDLILPDGSGQNVLDGLRDLPHGDRLPVLAFSVYVTDAERQRVLDRGFTDLLTKPVSPSLFAARVRAHLTPT